MAPEPEHAHGVLGGEHLIDEAVLDVDAPWPSGRWQRVCRRLVGPGGCKQSANSPVKCLAALVQRLSHASFNGLPHTGYGEQIQGFLNRPPIPLRHQHGAAALAGDVDRLMAYGGLVDQAVQIGTGFAGGQNRHTELLESNVR